MKRIWRIVLIVLLVVLGAFMLWPRNLGGAFDTEESMAVSVTIFGITNGQLDNRTEQYELPAGSEQGERIGELLEKHTYHLTLGSLVGKNVIEGPDMVLHLYNGKGELLTLAGGTAELNLDHRVYRLDYWGTGRGTELCEEILEILREA